MRSYRPYLGSRFGISQFFPKGVKWLLIINSAIFVFVFFLGILDLSTASALVGFFGLQTSGFLHGFIWQPFTYMFLHGSAGHILFNMLTLWMFGVDLERDWGTRRFLNFYFVCGVGAGLCDVIIRVLFHLSREVTTIGSSGAIYGLLLAFGLLYPTRTVFFSFLFPIQAKWFVLIMGVLAFMSSFNANSGVSNFAHLGGMLFGYLYLRYRLHRLDRNLFSLFESYQQWRRRRLQQKFKVYMRKREHEHDEDRDRWVN